MDKLKGRVARRLIEVRNALGLSQRAMAEIIGVSSAGVSRWEAGDYLPGFEEMIRFREMVGVPAEYFYQDDAEPLLARLTEIHRERLRIGELTDSDEDNSHRGDRAREGTTAQQSAVHSREFADSRELARAR